MLEFEEEAFVAILAEAELQLVDVFLLVTHATELTVVAVVLVVVVAVTAGEGKLEADVHDDVTGSFDLLPLQATFVA